MAFNIPIMFVRSRISINSPEIILKPATVNKLYGLTQNIGVNEMKSGLGWVIDQKEGEEWIYNNGLLPGYASLMGSMPSKNIKVIIFRKRIGSGQPATGQGLYVLW